MTTIGYGDQHPTTKGGQWFTVVFGMIAIPIMFLMLAVIGEILLNCCRWLNAVTFARCGRSFRNKEGGHVISRAHFRCIPTFQCPE